MRRIFLFLLTNLAVLLLLGIVCHVFGIDRWAELHGLGGLYGLLVYAAVIGMGGAFISLAMSKPMAKWSTGARVIETPAAALQAAALAERQVPFVFATGGADDMIADEFRGRPILQKPFTLDGVEKALDALA